MQVDIRSAKIISMSLESSFSTLITQVSRIFPNIPSHPICPKKKPSQKPPKNPPPPPPSSPLLMHQHMRRTNPHPLSIPPQPNTNPMKLTQTLHPAHLIPRLELLETNHAFLRLAVFGHAVLFCRAVDRHAAGAVAGCAWAGG